MPEQTSIILEPRETGIVQHGAMVRSSSADATQQLVGALFRHRGLIMVTFVCVAAGAVLATLLVGFKYQASTQLLIKHQRAEQVVSEDNNSHPPQNSTDAPTEREINTEISLLRSQDLLAQVVKDTGLDRSQHHFWDFLFPGHDAQWRLSNATRNLANSLRISEIPQSNMIEVAYRSRQPEQAARVLSDLDQQYLAKHLRVYRPDGVTAFFQQQAQHYQEQLQQAESQLASYDLAKGAADPATEKEILLKKIGDFDGDLQRTRGDISQTSKRIQEIQREMAATPSRLTTRVTAGDNPALLARLKGSLEDLETKRTDLLTKYQPTYRLVKDVDKQIANLQNAIAAESKAPVKEQDTNQNPTYVLLQAELAKAQTDLTAYRAKATATAPVVGAYKQQALLIDQTGIQREDLIRNIKASETNYLLYLQKEEQARISDALDKSRILNVAIAEAPTVPSLPLYSPWLLIVTGLAVAFMLSMAAGLVADYLDPSIRTPEEAIECLEVPLLACFPKDHYPPRLGLLAPANGPPMAMAAASESGEEDPGTSLWWRGRNE